MHRTGCFLATLVALHFTPVSKWVSESAEFRTSVASRLASLFTLGLPLKVQSTKTLILARLGCVSRTIYVNVDSPNLGFPYFNFLGEAQ